jgi:DNA-binding XRE family transcriptional regulator
MKKEYNTAYFRHLKYGYINIMVHSMQNNTLVILWRSVLLMEETGEPGENLTICRTIRQYFHYIHGPKILTTTVQYINNRNNMIIGVT